MVIKLGKNDLNFVLLYSSFCNVFMGAFAWMGRDNN